MGQVLQDELQQLRAELAEAKRERDELREQRPFLVAKIVAIEADRDRYRKALEEIAGMTRKTPKADMARDMLVLVYREASRAIQG